LFIKEEICSVDPPVAAAISLFRVLDVGRQAVFPAK